jgi:hypothetical protein
MNLAYAQLGLAMILVGANVGVAKLLSEQLPIALIACLRCMLAAALLWPLARALEGLPRLPADVLRNLFWQAVFGTAIYNAGLLAGLRLTTALEGGLAFGNASVALVHGMSRPIGAHFHVPHGLSNAMLLPAVTRYSLSAALPRYAEAARCMGCAGESDADQVAGAKLLEELSMLNAELSVPTPAAYGIDAERWNALLPTMAAQALASGSPNNNPAVPDAKAIMALYRECYG